MKKFFPLVLIFALLLTGCKVKEYTPEITDFVQNATVTSGEFSYKCEISKNNGVISVTAESTNAKGMRITYDGNEFTYDYQDMSYTCPEINQTLANPAKIIYEVFACITSSEELNASKTADGFRYDGSTSFGDFILLQNDDYTYKSICFKDINLNIIFS